MEIIATIEKTLVNNVSHGDNFVQKIPNYRVYKHNDLVECKSDFSAMEHRIIVLALSQITSQDENLKMYRINIKDVLGKKHASHYNLVRNAIKKLNKSTIDMEEKDGWKSYAFITKAQGKYGANYIEIQFHEDIQKFLLGLKSQYTSYTLHNVMNFKRNYSLRIYELCKQYQRIGRRTLKLDYLKTLFSLEKKYREFSDFKRDVLNPAMYEINKYSDIEVSLKERRNGRKMDSIEFFMVRKQGVSDQEGQTLEEVGIEVDNSEKLESLGFNLEDYYRLRDKYGSAKISGVLALFDRNIDEIKFPKPWIESALKDGFVDATGYKRKLVEKEDENNKFKLKLKEIRTKKIEISAIKEGIHYMELDLDTYRKTGSLKPGDVMRFPENFTVEKAIATMGKRLQEYFLLIEQKQEELGILEKELDSLF